MQCTWRWRQGVTHERGTSKLTHKSKIYYKCEKTATVRISNDQQQDTAQQDKHMWGEED